MNDPGVVELLAAAPAAHRQAVARQLGLAPVAGPEEIGAALRDRARMARVVGALSLGARRLAAMATFLDGGVVQQSWTGRVSASVAELERHGIAFAFRQSHVVEHWVPPDLRPVPRICGVLWHQVVLRRRPLPGS